MLQKNKIIIWLGRISLVLCIIAIFAALSIYLGFRASLPILTGEIRTVAIDEKVMVERDHQGNATITANNRSDLAYATGYIHAQDRFFQMDLSRRLASGELAELFGSVALSADKSNRIHRFRARARLGFKNLADDEKKVLNSYAAGVNEGLDALDSKPFEYWLLGAEPKVWSVEDSFLAIYSMYFTLQSPDGGYEWQNHLLRRSLHPELADFLLQNKTEWDAPLQKNETPYIVPKIPDASVIQQGLTIALKHDDSPMLGSNNWAVSGALTETGAGMLSNDMHLTIRAPSIWYKLRLKLADDSLDITGVSLPGAPAIVVGSNGFVAWGFTNTNIDTSDIIELRINPDNENEYLTQNGYRDFAIFDEIISTSDGSKEVLPVKETIWGPVIEKSDSNYYAYRWVAHMPDGANWSLMNMENMKSVDEVLSHAGDMGIPAQNAVIVDARGNIAWTIFGKLPRRRDGDYGQVLDWSDGTYEWNEWYTSAEYPKVVNPENNRLWTANNRVVSGVDLSKVGINRYDLGARAKQIKGRLMALGAPVQEKDLYDIMLDNEAVFLSRWQQQLVSVLNASGDDAFGSYLKEVENWGGYADKNSIGYRLVKEYRNKVFDRLMGHLTAACVVYDKSCDYDSATRQWEAPLWQLVTNEPDGWLPDNINSWQFFFEKMAFEAWQPAGTGVIALDDYRWGERNTSQIAHPLSRAIPFLGLLTDMPVVEQSGDTEHMPYITGRTKGQSERIVVSPGHEENGIMNLPAGQSGHPLSPYYGAGHNDWQEGNMSPFLPEETKWKLEFSPVK